MTAEQARELALSWLAATDEERAAAQQAMAKLQRVVALAADDPRRLEDVLRRLRDDARADPEVIGMVLGFLAGRKASRTPEE